MENRMINQTLLYRFFEGATSVEEEVKVKEWLEESEQNKDTFFKERRLFDAVILLGENRKKHLLEKKRRRTLYFLRETVKIAAVSIIVLMINNLYVNHQKEYPEEEQYQTITVPAGQRINLTLPDGTDVWLNARTKIRYPFTFNKDKREVFLDGEAYFDVSEDKQKPFVVQTSKYQLEVLGTTFNVEDYADKDDFETMLFNGSVKIISNDTIPQTITLTPAYKAYLKDGRLAIAHVDDYSVYRWREGLICFKDESFITIMSDFEKYYGLTIKIDNMHIKRQHYSGKFRQTDGIDYALRVLQKDIRFTYQRDDDQNIIEIE